jgi:hypothetical protein
MNRIDPRKFALMLTLSTTLALTGCATFKAVGDAGDDYKKGNYIKGTFGLFLMVPMVTMIDVLSVGALSKDVERQKQAERYGKPAYSPSTPVASASSSNSTELDSTDSSDSTADTLTNMFGAALGAAAQADAQKSARQQQLQQQRTLQRQQQAALQQQQLQLAEAQRQQRIAQQQAEFQRQQALRQSQTSTSTLAGAADVQTRKVCGPIGTSYSNNRACACLDSCARTYSSDSEAKAAGCFDRCDKIKEEDNAKARSSGGSPTGTVR